MTRIFIFIFLCGCASRNDTQNEQKDQLAFTQKRIEETVNEIRAIAAKNEFSELHYHKLGSLAQYQYHLERRRDSLQALINK